MKDYSNAFAEVYEILNHLDNEAYNKIPEEFIQTIEENRNMEYEFVVYEDIELKDHELLPETRAILFNIFRDYLCTPEQKEKIIKMQAEERKQNEEKKRQEYYASKPQEEKIEVEEKQALEMVTVEPPKTLWEKVKVFLKGLIKR